MWLIMGLVCSLRAQPDNEPVTITIPPSPTAQSITEYGQLDVSYNTGTPNVSIPITTIKAGRFTLPITISNHASGIRVTEDASWIGVGWTLHAGGAVSRTIRGLPDGKNIYGYYDFTESYDLPLNESDIVEYGILNDLAAGKYDGLPDIYSYSFAGYSGKFLIEKIQDNYVMQFLTQSNLVGTVLMSSTSPREPESFVFTTVDGTVFNFSEKEETTTDVYGDDSTNDNTFISSWFISFIQSSDKKTIAFSYAGESIDQELTVQSTDYVLSSCGRGKSAVNSFSQTHRDTKRLTTIIGEDKTLVFVPASTARTDLGGTSYALDYINVGGQYSVEFETYTSAGGKRMYLTSMEKKIENGENERYEFSYHDMNLPSTDSKDQDYWGFYNNAGNLTLLPKTPEMAESIIGANREPNEESMLSGSLKRVTYPTGGYTEYIMEPNKEIREQTGTYVERQRVLNAENVEYGDIVTSISSMNINFIQNVAFTIDMDYVSPNGEPAVVDVRLMEGGSIIKSKAVKTGEQWIFYDVPVGNYLIEVWNTGGFTVDKLTATSDYEEYTSGTVLEGRLIGGLRVKEIIKYDGESFVYNFYKYEDSRVLSDLDAYDFIFDIEEMSGSCFGGNAALCSFVGRTSSVRNSQPSQIISYGKVTEYVTSSENTGVQPVDPIVTPLPLTEIGKTVYTYSHPYSIGGGGLPYMPIQDLQYSKGQLLSQTVYSQDGQKLNETINQYETISTNLESLRYAKATFLLDWWCYSGQDGMGLDVISSHYITPKTGWKRLISTDTRQYDPENENIYISVIKNYGYFEDDDVVIFNPIKEETWTSDKKVTKYLYYTDSYSTGLSHIAAYPELLIEEVTTVDHDPGSDDSEMLVSSMVIEYSSEGPWPTAYYLAENEQPMTSSSFSFTKSNGSAANQGEYSLSNDLKLQATYNYSDENQKSKVTETWSKKGGSNTGYVWDDKGRLKSILLNCTNNSSRYVFDDFEEESATSLPFQGEASKVLSSDFNYSLLAGDYYVEYWKKGNVSLVQNADQVVEVDEVYTHGDWVFMQGTLGQSASGNLTIVGDGGNNDEIDCLRVFPIEAQMTNYMYNKFDMLTELIEPTGVIKFFIYDNLGRLLSVIDHEGNVLKQNNYHYKN